MRLLFAALALAVLATACSGTSSKPTSPSFAVGPSSPAPPTSTAAPDQSPFRPAPDAFVRLSYAPGQLVDATRGVFFMNSTTGAIEGWQLSDAAILADGDDPAVCCVAAKLSDDNRFIAVRDSTSSWLLDRKSGKTVAWDAGQMALVALSPHYLLFETAANPWSGPNPEFDGHYSVFDENLAPVSAFKLERAGRGSPPVLFSADEHTLIIPAGNKSWSDYTTLQEVDVATGVVRQLADLPPAPTGYSPGALKFSLLGGGSEFAVALSASVPWDAPRAAAGDPPYRTLVRRYLWDGTLRAEFELATPGVTFSPDGKLLAYDQIQRFVLGETDGPSEYWANVVVADGLTGSPLVRVRSASLYYGDGLGDPRWLADSSGIPVAVRPWLGRAPDLPYWRYRGFMLLLPNTGRLQPLGLVEDDALAPTPSPDRPGLFATGHTGVVEPAIGRSLAANGRETWYQHIPPWGSSSTELRFALPHGGHGAGYRGTFLAPQIEYPPFDDRLAFHVAGTGSCLNLRSGPSNSASTSSCLPDGADVVLSDPSPGSANGKLAAWFADETLWIHVRTSGGDEGWVSSEYLQW